MVAGAVGKIVLAAQAACGDDDALQDLGAAATAVTEALGVQMDNIAQYDEACEAILAATDRLFSSEKDAFENSETHSSTRKDADPKRTHIVYATICLPTYTTNNTTTNTTA